MFDTRNNDTLIRSTRNLSMDNTDTGAIQELYYNKHQTLFRPAVPAATSSGQLTGLYVYVGVRNADENYPYRITRRPGVAVDIAKPFHLVFMDARDVTRRFTAGNLQGGTHTHNWSAHGKWISFTYNDFVISEQEKNDSFVKELLTVGVMVPGHPVHVPYDASEEIIVEKCFL